ncbi:unnamed protein product, partial [Brassica oleracea var. botrytis]
SLPLRPNRLPSLSLHVSSPPPTTPKQSLIKEQEVWKDFETYGHDEDEGLFLLFKKVREKKGEIPHRMIDPC